MGEQSFFDKLKEVIGGIAFDIFLWCNDMTQEQYWQIIYEQEKICKETPELIG